MNTKYPKNQKQNGNNLKSALMKILKDLDTDISDNESTPETLLYAEEGNEEPNQQERNDHDITKNPEKQ
jgi:hypothetical protein